MTIRNSKSTHVDRRCGSPLLFILDAYSKEETIWSINPVDALLGAVHCARVYREYSTWCSWEASILDFNTVK